MSIAKPVLAGQEGPQGRRQEAQRTSKHTQMGEGGQLSGSFCEEPPRMPPLLSRVVTVAVAAEKAA